MPPFGQYCHNMRDFKCLSHVICVTRVDSYCISRYITILLCIKYTERPFDRVSCYNIPCYAIVWSILIVTVYDSVTLPKTHERGSFGKISKKNPTFPAILNVTNACAFPNFPVLRGHWSFHGTERGRGM